jgi:parallel beta-helix repeat protein
MPPIPAAAGRASPMGYAARRGDMLALLLPSLLACATAQASTVQVNNLSDSGTGSLRDAIALATPGDDIVFAPGLSGTVHLSSGLLFNKSLHMIGYGITLDGGDSVTVISLQDSAVVTLDGLTVQHGWSYQGGGIVLLGTLVMNNCSVHDNHADHGAGGIYVGAGSLTLNASHVDNNTTLGQGGGIWIDWGTASASINGSTVSGNQAGTLGGGISHTSSTPLTISFSHITGNTAYDNAGGGIHVENSELTVLDSDVSNNKADFGGGIYLHVVWHLTTLVLERALVNGNTAFEYGGGVLLSGATMNSKNSTIAYNFSNSTTVGGGGINMETSGNDSPSAVLTHTTVAFNRSAIAGGGIAIRGASVSLKNSIVGGNIANTDPDVQGAFTSLGYNLVQTRDGSTGYVGSDLPNAADPALATLAYNGGPTSTLYPLVSSAAINAVVAANCSDTVDDQRSYRRSTGNCDIGALDTEGFVAIFANGFE